jgi:hypothetical protein
MIHWRSKVSYWLRVLSCRLEIDHGGCMFVTYYQLASHVCVALAVCAGCCTHLLHPCISWCLKLHRQYPAAAVSSVPDSVVAVGQSSTSRGWGRQCHTEHVPGLLVALRQRCAVIVQEPSPVIAVVRCLCAVHGRRSSCCCSERLAQDSIP